MLKINIYATYITLFYLHYLQCDTTNRHISHHLQKKKEKKKKENYKRQKAKIVNGKKRVKTLPGTQKYSV